MICPYCGTVDTSISNPNVSRGDRAVLTDCPDCGETIHAVGTTDEDEDSPLETVHEYETEEGWAVDLYVQRELPNGSTHEDRETDIDREIRGPDGEIDHFLEYKSRTCSINAYDDTMFRDRKLKEARELHSEHDVPVKFLIRFLDCWAIHEYQPNREYEIRGMYRSDRGQYEDHALVPVEEFRILGWQEHLQGV
ncbi:hypothetical protein [Halobellus rarus]|uniref:Restriction endonuclease n=1 Tax=Halobellus rarus TaxID=1126237 RepID=A0ABD6CQI7_9EURY|nr:hypothetical protein [Halobellus rarus]